MKVLASLAFLFFATTAQAQPGELIDRTLAIVGGQVITLGDVNAAIALGLIEVATDASPATAGTTRLVDRLLILREVQRYAPPDPNEAAIDARMEELRAKLGARLARALEQTGFTEARLRAWVRDDLRSQIYLAQRFAAAGAPSEQEIAATFTRERASSTSSTVPLKDANGPSETRTCSPTSNVTDGLGRSMPS